MAARRRIASGLVFAVITFALTGLPQPSQAFTILMDQRPDYTDYAIGSEWEDMEYADAPAFTRYQVHDVTVGSQGWVVQRITTYYEYYSDTSLSLHQARLNIFDKSASLPDNVTDDPSVGAIHSIVVGIDPEVPGWTQGCIVVMSDLNITLDPGSYWVGLTPVGLQEDGMAHVWAKDTSGDPSAFRTPFAGGPSSQRVWKSAHDDSAILIEGREGLDEIPEPTSLTLLALGIAGSIAGLRRRVAPRRE